MALKIIPNNVTLQVNGKTIFIKSWAIFGWQQIRARSLLFTGKCVLLPIRVHRDRRRGVWFPPDLI